ncbi:MAG: DNA-processing protein DprA [Hyphomicrobiales bacterium]
MDLNHEERRDWLRLMLSENVGPATFRALIERYGSAGDALEALPALSAKGGLRRAIRICSEDRAETHLARAAQLSARFVAVGETGYPSLLAHVDDAPPMICIRGRPEILERPCFAIVGARNASALGRKFARTIARDLGQAGFTIVSGLARGVDTAAHEASVDIATAAVLAGGIDNIYPPENADLHGAIAEQGLLISEHPPGTQPQAQNFPRRNRLISGMSYGALIVEAAKRSGSLITARLALEQNREVFAVPGSPLDPRAEGANKLIRDGATLVRCADDILEVIAPVLDQTVRGTAPHLSEPPPETPPAAEGEPSHKARAKLMELLGPAPADIDDLIRESKLDTGTVLTILLELELAGTIERLPRNKVALTGSG